MKSVVVTIRLPEPLHRILCKVAEENMELPSETARRILRENLKQNADGVCYGPAGRYQMTCHTKDTTS